MKWAALGIGALIAVALLWIGGEEHYRSCIETVEARHPVALLEHGPRSIYRPAKPMFVFYGESGKFREAAIDNCTRLP